MRSLLTLIVLLTASQAFALTAEWTRSPESDAKDYHMYMCEGKNCTVLQSSGMHKATIPQTAVGVVPKWPIPAGKEGAIAVSAMDTSGNESVLSNVVFFDQTPPPAPTGLAVK